MPTRRDNATKVDMCMIGGVVMALNADLCTIAFGEVPAISMYAR